MPVSPEAARKRRAALRRLSAGDPELAARLAVAALPAAAALQRPLTFRLEIEGVGSWLVDAPGGGGPASVTADGSGADAEFELRTDAGSLAALAGGRGPLRALVAGRIRVSGKRRRALALRRLDREAGLREAARAGAELDPDLVHRALAFVIDPEWTAGHRFAVAYELTGERGGTWTVEVDDGTVRVDSGTGNGSPDATVRTTLETWLALVRGDVSPSTALQRGDSAVVGALPPVTLLGRWIDRAEGLDEGELERERHQRDLQESRAGAWGSSRDGSRAERVATTQGDPGHRAAGRRPRSELLGYQQLYALWERQNWRSHELDFSVDREHWLATPTEAQRHTAWTLGSFYVGEERVTADLAPFLLAAPSGEVEVFLATQLVDEARHAVFFDRWAAEVMALGADEMRGRLHEAEATMLDAWHFLFDDGLRGVAERIKARPDDLELFVEGIVTYHMVTEGVLAMTGQRVILSYLEAHGVYPGFQEGFSLVERDEHRHIAFGVRFLRDACAERPELRDTVLQTLDRLLPRAAEVFAPPEAASAADFFSYDFHSSQVYGFAYTALERRMRAIGIEIPPAEELMPGPVDVRGLEGEGARAPAAA